MEASELKSNFFSKCSLLVLEPKRPFLEWVEKLQAVDQYDYFYDERENGVWIIKNTGLFADEEELNRYLFSLKPQLLRSEFERFTGDYPCEITSENFDNYFDLIIRDVISNVADISGGQNN